MIRFLVLFPVLFFLQPPCNLKAQSTNPFEIRSVDSMFQSDTLASLERRLYQPQILKNPFDLRPPTNEIKLELGVPKRMSLWNAIGSWTFLPTTDKEIKNILFWMLLFITFLLAIALNLNRDITTRLVRSVFNLNFFSLMNRDNKDENKFIYSMLYGLYFIGLSIFIYLFILHFKGKLHPVTLIILSASICLVYAIRHLSLKILGFVYGIEKETNRLIFSVVLFGCILAIILVPLDFIISFVRPELARTLLIITSVFIGIFYLFRIGRDSLLTFNTWRNSIFHFLLYLCTCEIAPLTLLYVFLQRQGVLG
ncbi:MAG: DUF4271 domain-containing protein [Bacteroidota bacterium]|nr:DUF4271 domain-containing protein [Bacteroidota bacterium]